jgi:ribosomal protein S24E
MFMVCDVIPVPNARLDPHMATGRKNRSILQRKEIILAVLYSGNFMIASRLKLHVWEMAGVGSRRVWVRSDHRRYSPYPILGHVRA